MLTVDFDHMDIRPEDRILDIGCGSGRHVAAAASIPSVLSVGADVKHEDLLDARNRLRFHESLRQCLGQWALLGADILRLPFSDDFFDRVICCEVLEHVPNHRQAISELTRVLKPGQIMAVSVPRYGPERICWALSKKYRNIPGGHIRIYRPRKLIGLFRSFGLSVEHFHYAHSLHTPYWWLKCALGLPKDSSIWIRGYHRFLVWELMKRPQWTRRLERLLNPLIGKSLVVYLKKRNGKR